MASQTSIAPGRNAAQEVAVPILVVGYANHRRLALLRELAAVAGQALVGVEVERIALDRVRNERRLIRVVAPTAHIIGDLALHRRSGRLSREGGGPLEARRFLPGPGLLAEESAGDETRQHGPERQENEAPHGASP